MKTAPHLAAALTACVALAAGYVLATQDRAFFDPHQALVVWADEAQGPPTLQIRGDPTPAPVKKE